MPQRHEFKETDLSAYVHPTIYCWDKPEANYPHLKLSNML